MTAFLTTLFLPLAGALLMLFISKDSVKLIKYFALGISLLAFVASLVLFFSFDSANPGFQYYHETIWIGAFDAGFRIGLDGMSMMLLMLTTFITPLAIMASFESIKKHHKIYFIMILLLQFGMTGVFVSLDLFLFYIFWELILVPMYFIIGVWGGKNKLYAAVKFFIFTVVGSLFMLLAIVWLGYYSGTTLLDTASGFTTNYLDIREVATQIPFSLSKWMFLAFALSFLIKVPIFPLHTWLPDAHTEAPTPGSIVLAGLLLKMGTYGLIRFNLELFPEASIYFAPVISILAVIGIIYGALVAMIQKDYKRLIAYTSVAHMGFIVLGIFSMTVEGVQGAIIQMVNHGLTTGMLFLLVGMLYERRHTRLIADFGGIAHVMPAYTAFFAIAMFASIGLPGLNGFVGEYLTLLGAFQSRVLNSIWFTVIGTSGVIFAAVYLLWMFQRIFLGTIDNEANQNLKDVSVFEKVMLIPFVIFILWIGLYPRPFLNVSEASTTKLIQKIEMMQFGNSDYRMPEPAEVQDDKNDN